MPRSRHDTGRSVLARLIGAWLLLVLVIVWLPRADTPSTVSAAGSVTGLHVVGNQIRNGANQTVRLRGVNRPSPEYACIQNWGVIAGDTSAASIQAMVSWNINVVRLPLNEDCWLDVNMDDINPAYRGSNYRNTIFDYVSRLTDAGLAVILDLHWSAPGTQKATGQMPMPDRDHSPAFWQSVANTFKSNSAVIFDLFNEPYPDSNVDSTAAWTCLRSGTTGVGSCPGVGFAAAGMQELLDVVRGTGATNLVMIPGVGYTGLLTRWIEFKPVDSLNPPNIAASTHIYPEGSWCREITCWNTQLAPVAAAYPLIIGEMGQTSCAHNLIDGVMDWADARQQHYLAWAWWTEPCGSPAYYGLISNHTTGAPRPGYGEGYRNRLLATAIPTSTPSPTPTQSPTPTRTPTATLSAGCSSRPPVTVRAEPNGDGRLRITVAVSGAGNTLLSVHLTADQRATGGALIDTTTQTGMIPPHTLSTITAGATSTVFWIRPVQPSQPVTLPMVVIDNCGPWSTFVGAGAGAI